MRSFVAILSLAATALAYQINSPSNATGGWTIDGPNEVTWTMVNTDPANFTIVLSNQQVSPPTQQVLNALVDGTLGKIDVNPPSGGWRTGVGFQVNFVKDSQDLNSILAQSGQFSIMTPTSSSSSGASTLAHTLTAPSLTNTATGGAVTAPSGTGASGALNPSSSTTSTTPNSAASSMGMQSGLFAVLALLGAFVAA